MITAIGSANVDHVIHTHRMPLVGETLVGGDYQINAGGKGLNQAVAMAKFGGNVRFFGMLGTDEGGTMLSRVMEESGLPFVGERVADSPTGVAMITVADGDNAIVLYAGANDRLTPCVVAAHAHLIEQSDYVVMQLEIPVESVAAVCDIARRHDTKVILNPAPFKELPASVFKSVEWLIPNEHEARELTGIAVDDCSSAFKAVRRLQELGARRVVITLGENGCVYTDGDEIYHRAAEQTTVVDTTSAGDSFIGAFVTKLSQGCNVAAAIEFATKAAAVTVSRKGASCSVPFASELL